MPSQQELREQALRLAREQQKIKEQLEQTGASVASSLGAPVGLPSPGDQPGGDDVRSVRVDSLPPEEAYVAGDKLKDDYHDVMQDSGFGDVANPNPPPQGHKVGGLERAKLEHPILGALRRDFGLDAIETTKVRVGGHEWTLGVLDARELAFVSRLADQFAVTMSEREFIANAAVAATAVRAIDSVPIYEVFQVRIEPGTVIDNDLLPPRHVRVAGAMKMFEFLMENSRNKLVTTLFEVYADKLDNQDSVTSYLNDSKAPRFRYRSSETSYEFVDFPRVDDSGNELPYYCKHTGAAMVKIAKVVGGEDFPLE